MLAHFNLTRNVIHKLHKYIANHMVSTIFNYKCLVYRVQTILRGKIIISYLMGTFAKNIVQSIYMQCALKIFNMNLI